MKNIIHSPITCCFISIALPNFEHRRSLLGRFVGVLLFDRRHFVRRHVQLLREFLPIFVQQICNIGQSNGRSVDSVWTTWRYKSTFLNSHLEHSRTYLERYKERENITYLFRRRAENYNSSRALTNRPQRRQARARFSPATKCLTCI